MKKLICKKTFYTFIAAIVIIATGLYGFINRIPRIGENGDLFNLTFSNWQRTKKYQNFQKEIRQKVDNYVLIEAGITNGGGYEYYLVNLDQPQIYADFLQVKGRFNVNKEFIGKIKYLLKNLNSKNQIYDGTSDVMTDDVIFILNYKNQKSIIKFGTYSLHFGSKNVENNRFKNIISTNKNILNIMIDLIEKEIYRQNSNLFKNRPFLVN